MRLLETYHIANNPEAIRILLDSNKLINMCLSYGKDSFAYKSTIQGEAARFYHSQIRSGNYVRTQR